MKKFTTIKTPARVLGALALALVLGGCFESHMTIQMGTYDSGVLVHEFGISDAYLNLLASFGDGFPPENGDALYSRQDLDEIAETFGEGVTLLDFRPIQKQGYKGYVARFAFKDINKLRVNPIPGTEDEDTGEAVLPTFRFTPTRAGNDLGITYFAHAEEATRSADLSTTIDPSLQEYLPLMAGMKASFKIQFEGRIVPSGTTASHVNGNVVTIFDFDFDRLSADPAARAIFVNNLGNPIAAWKALSGKPGLVIETKPEVFVRAQ